MFFSMLVAAQPLPRITTVFLSLSKGFCQDGGCVSFAAKYMKVAVVPRTVTSVTRPKVVSARRHLGGFGRASWERAIRDVESSLLLEAEGAKDGPAGRDRDNGLRATVLRVLLAAVDSVDRGQPKSSAIRCDDTYLALGEGERWRGGWGEAGLGDGR